MSGYLRIPISSIYQDHKHLDFRARSHRGKIESVDNKNSRCKSQERFRFDHNNFNHSRIVKASHDIPHESFNEKHPFHSHEDHSRTVTIKKRLVSDKVTAHLGKNIISNILQTARASLKEPSRPYIPNESQRVLFTNSDLHRPSSSYSIKTLTKDLEPIKQRPVVFESPIQINRKVMVEENKNSSRKPIKVLKEIIDDDNDDDDEEEEIVLKDIKNIIDTLNKIRYDLNTKKLFDDYQLEQFLETITETLAELKYFDKKPKWASCEEVLKTLALTLETFENDTFKVMKISKALLDNITQHDLLYKKQSKSIVTSTFAIGAIKVLYQYSKSPSNDIYFIEEDLFEVLHTLLISILSEDCYTQIELPYDFLLFLLGTLKNITNNTEIQSSKLISPLSCLLPTPVLDTVPHTNPKHSNLLVQVSGILKNISLKDHLDAVSEYQLLEKLMLTIQIYADEEIVINCLTAISDLSLLESVLYTLSGFIKIIIDVIQSFQSPMIVSRACCILANIFTIQKELDIQEETLANIGKILAELMPKPLVPCNFNGCGRKFQTPELLEDHWNRRHA